MVRKKPSILVLLLAVLCHCQCEVSESIDVISLKLVQRNFHGTPPFLHEALGFQQRNESSETRASRISDKKQYYVFPDYIRPNISFSDYMVTVDARIGTPTQSQYLIFDIGSSLIWTQCSPCKNCFSQTLPLFDPNNSTSYRKMDRSHRLSNIYNTTTSPDGSLIYKEKYLGNRTSQGILSLETFTFTSSFRRLPQSTRNIVFGCANNNLGNWPNNAPITGIMGMDRSPLSFVGQLGGAKVVRRFSFCLPRHSSRFKTTILRFGADVVKTRSDLLTTKLLSKTKKYKVNLKGISIAGRRLKLPRGTFSSGCFIETACSQTRLVTGAYNEVVKIFTQHFDRLNLTRLTGPTYEGRLCYPMRPEFNSFPNMTFHFEGSCFSRGVDFQIGHENLFARLEHIFCMKMDKQADLTTLGAFQMQNVRFIFDLAASKVLFGPEDCSKDTN